MEQQFTEELMNKYMALPLFLLVLSLSCSADDKNETTVKRQINPKTYNSTPNPTYVVKQNKPIEQSDALTVFFNKCKIDLDNAANVIETKDVVFNLSHLQVMNTGGDKYYLLERENISEMINAVIQKIYSDYILINQNGTVIYTKINDVVFSKNIKNYMQPKVLRDCFENTSSVFVSDITKLNNSSNNDVILISRKVKASNGFSGTLILQMNSNQIQKVIGDTKFIIGSEDGKYRITKEKAKINSSYEFFSLINKNFLSTEKNTLLIPEKHVTGRAFSYSSLSWIILKNEVAVN